MGVLRMQDKNKLTTHYNVIKNARKTNQKSLFFNVTQGMLRFTFNTNIVRLRVVLLKTV